MRRRGRSLVLPVALVLTLGSAGTFALFPRFGPVASSSDSRRASPAGTRMARGSVRVDSLWSQALGTHKRYVIWLPPSYQGAPERRYPVAYYLHGVGGDETNWTRRGGLDATLDSLVAAGMPEMIVVMPDGDDGWYTTWNSLGDYAGCRRNRPALSEDAASYCVPWPHYDDYVARDLVGHVDRTYRTIPDRRQRGIAGLSMGGYGAITLALSYPEVFAAAASHSGVLVPMAREGEGGPRSDRRRYPPLDSLRVAYGSRLWALMEPAFGKDTLAWLARDPLHRADRLARSDRSLVPRLFVDCGTDDSLIRQNRAFRRGMERLGVPVTYAEWPGSHSWDYWSRHAGESARWLAARFIMR
jgi:S-formylglutathione hydrolase FrmB